MLEPIDMAWELVRKVAGTTMFDKEFNDGLSLPFHVAKKAAINLIEVFMDTETSDASRSSFLSYWNSIYQELIKLEL